MDKTSVIYVRVSDQKQAEENISVPAQIELGSKRSRELGASILKVFSDEGRSAFKESNRRTFEAAIEYAVLMKATYFIVWSSSRFARNQLESVLYKRELDRAGVKLVYVSMSIDRDTDEGWLVDGVLGLIDEMQSRQNSKDTKRSMMRNAEQGYWGGGRPPFGYRSQPAEEDPRRRRLVVVPDEALIVRDVFASRAAFAGAKVIALGLNARGFTNRGSKWCKSSVLALLRNQAYVGRVVFNRKDRRTGRDRPSDQWVVVQSHEPIIEREVWDMVQKLLNDAADRSAGSPKSEHVFTGMLKCGECGESLQIETAKGRSRVYSYYNCRANQTGGRCLFRRLRADYMDQWLGSIILDRVLSTDNLRAIAASLEDASRVQTATRDERRRPLQAEMRSMKERNSKIYDLFETYGKDTPNLGDVTERLRANNDRIKAIEAELSALDAEMDQRFTVTDAEIEILGDMLREIVAEPAHAAPARAFYSAFISRIVINDRIAEIRYDAARLLAQPAQAHSAPATRSHAIGRAARAVHSEARWLPERSSLRTNLPPSPRQLTATLPVGLCRAA